MLDRLGEPKWTVSRSWEFLAETIMGKSKLTMFFASIAEVAV